MTEVRVYNPSLELQGIIDEYHSLTWIRRYQDPGEFEMVLPYSDDAAALLQPENIVHRRDGTTKEAGVIEYLQITDDDITVKGRFLESYLDRRLIKETEYYTGLVESSIRSIITGMVAIPLLELGAVQGFTDTLIFQATYKSVLNVISKACRNTNMGFRIRPDFVQKKLIFELYRGKDSSDTVVFSETYDNLQEETYEYDSTNYRTKAYATQIVNDARKVVSVGSGSGLGLRECHLATTVDTDGFTDSQISASMETEAQKLLDASTVYENFTFMTDSESPYVYRTDYDIGDMVRVRHDAWNISAALQLCEIEEVYQSGGRDIILTCGGVQPETAGFSGGSSDGGLQVNTDPAFKSGDTWVTTGTTQFQGMCNNAGTGIVFTVLMPKTLANISSITVDTCKGIVYGLTGRVDSHNSSSYNWKTSYTIVASKIGDYAVKVTITTSGSSFTGAASNTPLTASMELALSFS